MLWQLWKRLELVALEYYHVRKILNINEYHSGCLRTRPQKQKLALWKPMACLGSDWDSVRYFVTSDVGDGRIQWYAFCALPAGTHKAPQPRDTVENGAWVWGTQTAFHFLLNDDFLFLRMKSWMKHYFCFLILESWRMFRLHFLPVLTRPQIMPWQGKSNSPQTDSSSYQEMVYLWIFMVWTSK